MTDVIEWELINWLKQRVQQARGSLSRFRYLSCFAMLCLLLAGCSFKPDQQPDQSPTAQGVGSQNTGANGTETLVNRASRVADSGFVRPTAPATDFVGSQICRQCHEAICKKYDSHPMSRSAAVMADVPVIENLDQAPVRAIGGFLYHATVKDGKAYHHESLPDAAGELLYEQAEQIDYVIGSGERGRSYLLARNDLLVMSPLTWYTQGNRFDLSPGYGEQNRHFERAISDGCVQCHVGRVRQEAQAANTFLTPAFDEVAIGCERCHGPAGRHVTYRLDPAQELSPSLTPEVEAARRQELREGDPIINPTQLGPEERESVCNQCHLTGGERVLQYGRTEYDFRPGQHLGDVWAIYTRGDGIQAGGRTEAVGQVEQMRASVCFQSSAGRFGCTSCHDPHTIPTQGERTEFYRSKCLNCHSGAQSTCSLNEAERLQRVADDSCIACHMPRLSASDVPHTAQTDHRVLRIPVQKPFSANTEQPYRLFGDLAEKLSAPEQDRAEGILMSRVATELKDIWLAEQATLKLQGVTLPADDVEGWLALADAYSTQNRPGLAEEIWKRLLVDQPNEERALKSLAISHHNTGRVQEASDLFDRYFNIRPRDRQIAGRSVHVLGQTSQWVRAIQRAEQTVALYPWDWQLQGWLAEAYQTQGKLDAAETPLRILRTIKPPNP